MAIITINDIKASDTMSVSSLERVKGGNYWMIDWSFMYRNVFNQFRNPIGYGIQQQTFNTSRMWDNHNANWMSTFKSGW